MTSKRRNRIYDHRLIQLVQDTGDITIATHLGVPRSTAAGWLCRGTRPVTTAPRLDESAAELRVRVARLERRVRLLRAILRIAIAVVRILQPDLTRLRVPIGSDKTRLLRAIDRARGVLGLSRILKAIGLSPSRLSAWRRAAQGCELDDAASCPAFSPHGLTADEVARIEEMVTSTQYRHVPTGRLAMLAQRIGKVFASASTWYRLVDIRHSELRIAAWRPCPCDCTGGRGEESRRYCCLPRPERVGGDTTPVPSPEVLAPVRVLLLHHQDRTAHVLARPCTIRIRASLL